MEGFLIARVIRSYRVDMTQALVRIPPRTRPSMRFSRALSKPTRGRRRMIRTRSPALPTAR